MQKHRRRQGWILLSAVLSFTASVSSAQDLEERVVEGKLPNGLTYLIVERHQAPVFAARLYVKVGGVDDPQYNSGLAHLFEHMAFKGTPWIGTSDYLAELPIMEEMDRVAALFTSAKASVPLRDRASLNELIQEWAGRIQSAVGGRLDRPELLPALIDSLGAVASTAEGRERHPSLGLHLQALNHETELLRLQKEQAKHIVKEEFWQLMKTHGGTGLNAGTGKDYTVYYEEFPANRLEQWALLGSERILYPVMREFYAERDVVAEERRMRVDSNPDGKLYEQFLATAFQVHPYRVPIVGWDSEINQVDTETARAFYKRYYTPENMVVVLVGDVDTTVVHRLMYQYFGRIPSSPRPPDIVAVEPEQLGERRIVIEDDADPRVMIGFHKPTLPHRDDYVFDVIDGILSGGRTSRLYERLVKAEDRVASHISTFGSPGSRYDNLFVIDARPIGDATTADIEEKVYEVLEELASEPVSERELQKIKNQTKASFIRGLATNSGLAGQLGYYQTVAGDWRYIVNHSRILDGITAADVQRVARTYFKPSNRTVATRIRRSDGGAE